MRKWALWRGLLAAALAAGGVLVGSSPASAYATWECNFSFDRTASRNGTVLILRIYRCPDGHDYARGIVSGSSGARNARVWLDDSINGGASWVQRQWSVTESRSTQTAQDNLMFDGAPHKARACGDTSDTGYTICTTWY